MSKKKFTTPEERNEMNEENIEKFEGDVVDNENPDEEIKEEKKSVVKKILGVPKLLWNKTPQPVKYAVTFAGGALALAAVEALTGGIGGSDSDDDDSSFDDYFDRISDDNSSNSDGGSDSYTEGDEYLDE